LYQENNPQVASPARVATVRERWIAALRSGKYKRCTGQLRRGDRFCALGVLADIIDPGGWAPSPGGNYVLWRGAVGNIGTSTYVAGVEDGRVITWNDASKLSFSEIADRLERETTEPAR